MKQLQQRRKKEIRKEKHSTTPSDPQTMQKLAAVEMSTSENSSFQKFVV